MFDPAGDAMIKRIDERSNELDQDLRSFLDRCRENDPESDPPTQLVWWMVQKLAGLQILVEELNQRIGKVGNVMDIRTRG